MNVVKLWHGLFLEERPSISLSFFRLFVAITTGFHVIPTFFTLQDSYLSTALKSINTNFFTPEILALVQQSSDGVVMLFVGLFLASWLAFLLGFRAQWSCIILTLCCYYFYALNCMHIGTLSWDILLVTLVLMCVTPYHGDYFSIDALRRNDPDAWKKERPYFIQRLLQLQIASTYFFTALHKIYPAGNWLSGNPLYALMNYPPYGVTKNFMLKEWLATQPALCYYLGVFIVVMELSLALLLFYRKTRRSAVFLGIFFHVLLLLTFDVPAIFFFLFPAQFLLFFNPKEIVSWIQHGRDHGYQLKVLYDADCSFCKASIDRLKVMDLWGRLTYEPLPDAGNELKLQHGPKEYGGFFAFRRLCFELPMLYPMLLFVYLPGASIIGRLVYQWIAANRRCLIKRPV